MRMSFVSSMLFLLLQGCLSAPADDAALSASSPEPDCPQAKPTRVFILGDRTGNADDDVFSGVLEEMKRFAPDMVIAVGDLIEGYQEDLALNETEQEWDHVLDLVRRALGDTPFFSVAGNHDVWSEQSRLLFEKKLGHHINHAMDVGSARIILFDTSRYASEAEIPEAALEWLWRQLYTARKQAVRIVITHRPLWAIDPGGRYGSPLHDVFIAGNADWVLSGHWHHTMSDDRDGIKYRLIGPSGALPNRPDHPESGNLQIFGFFVIDDRRVDLSLIPAGSVRPSDAYPYRFNQLEWIIENRAVQIEGFNFISSHPKPRGKFRLTLKNVTEEKMSGTLAFDNKRSAWRIAPVSKAVVLDPGESTRLVFWYSRRRNAALFPGPYFSIAFPWPDNGTYVLGAHISPTVVAHQPGPL